jgi:hypothetical protein
LIEVGKKELFEKLSQALEIGDCTAIAAHAHALKGVGRNLIMNMREYA